MTGRYASVDGTYLLVFLAVPDLPFPRSLGLSR
jgi:hypothetical protein